MEWRSCVFRLTLTPVCTLESPYVDLLLFYTVTPRSATYVYGVGHNWTKRQTKLSLLLRQTYICNRFFSLEYQVATEMYCSRMLLLILLLILVRF